jgi:poly(A) polymerase
LPRAAPLLLYLDRLGLLTVIFPELAQTKGVEQPQEHFWDVFHHSIQTVAAVEQLLRIDESVNKEGVEVAPWSPKLAQHFEDEIGNVKRSTLVKLAALLHDIAKPKTKSIERDGRVHFLGHAKEGAAMVGNILGRLRFSTPQIRAVQRMVEHHLRLWQMSNIPSQIFDLAGGSGSPQNLRFCGDKNEGLPTRRAIYRYFRDTGDVAIDIVWLSLADYLATRGPNLDLQEWEKHAQLMDYIMSEYEKEESIVSPPKLISGHDLIDLFGMQPGPKIGEILEAVREAQGMGEIKTREEALAFVSRQICSLH